MDKTISPSTIVSCILLLAAAVLFVIKFLNTVKTRKANNRTINFKWFGWYWETTISGSSSNWYKDYMRRFNRITVAMWACIIFAALVYLLGRYFML